MSDLNTAGLNGKGQMIARVADHALLVLAARIMAAAGIPIAAWLFAQVWYGQQELLKEVTKTSRVVAIQSERLDGQARRIDRVEGDIEYIVRSR